MRQSIIRGKFNKFRPVDCARATGMLYICMSAIGDLIDANAFRMSAYGGNPRAHLFNVGCSYLVRFVGHDCRAIGLYVGITRAFGAHDHIPATHCMLCVEIAQRLLPVG